MGEIGFAPDRRVTVSAAAGSRPIPVAPGMPKTAAVASMRLVGAFPVLQQLARWNRPVNGGYESR